MASASRAPAPPVASPFRTALIDLCFERGFAAVTVEALCERAGLDRAAFEDRYADLEDCFFQICRGELGRYRRRASAARAGLGDWRARLRATAYALYRYLDEDERRRKFAMVEVRTAGERPALLIGEEIERLSDLIDEGRAEPTAPPTLTRATAESLGGGIFNQIYLAASHTGPMPHEEEEVPKMMYSAVLPYLGAARAAEELEIPPPPRPADTDRVSVPRPDNLPAVAARRGGRRGGRLGELGPLPGGHHGLSREQILESQRERLLAAVAHEVAARGYRATTITEVVKLASVSTRDFYEHFEGKEQLFLAAFEAVRDHLEELLATATADQPDWPHQVIAALRTALRFFAAEPDLARLSLVEPVSATPTIAIRFREVVLACAPALARGRDELADGHSLPQSTEDSLLGGIVSLATRTILAGETSELPVLLPDLVEFTLSPYLGAERAAALAAETGPE